MDYLERAQTAEAKYNTLHANTQLTLDRVKEFKENMKLMGITEKGGGIDIDFTKLVNALGEAQAVELKNVISEVYGV